MDLAGRGPARGLPDGTGRGRDRGGPNRADQDRRDLDRRQTRPAGRHPGPAQRAAIGDHRRRHADSASRLRDGRGCLRRVRREAAPGRRDHAESQDRRRDAGNPLGPPAGECDGGPSDRQGRTRSQGRAPVVGQDRRGLGQPQAGPASGGFCPGRHAAQGERPSRSDVETKQVAPPTRPGLDPPAASECFRRSPLPQRSGTAATADRRRDDRHARVGA